MEVEVEVRGFGEYVVINPTIVGAYRMLIYNARMTVARLRTMAGQGHTMIGDIDCGGQRKALALTEWLHDHEWRDSATIPVTCRCYDNKRSIDKILIGNGAEGNSSRIRIDCQK